MNSRYQVYFLTVPDSDYSCAVWYEPGRGWREALYSAWDRVMASHGWHLSEYGGARRIPGHLTSSARPELLRIVGQIRKASK